MKTTAHSLAAALVLGILSCISTSMASADDAIAAVQTATDGMLAVLSEAPGYVEENPERYYQAVHKILDPVIDYRGFARGVMGAYASTDRYRSLDEAGRDKLKEQLARFTETMRVGLIRTYGKGLLAFGGSRIEVVDDESIDPEAKSASVRQLIYAEDSDPYTVLYQMGRNREGEWKLRNVIIEAINLGQVYRNQFEAAARKYDGDLDAVINNWASPDVETG